MVLLKPQTGRRITGYQWTEVPMPAEVVDRVHALARRDYTLAGLVVVDRTGDILDGDEDHDDDISFVPEAEEDIDDDADLAAALLPVPSYTLAGVVAMTAIPTMTTTSMTNLAW
jgi:hypothetical protein